MTGLGREFKCQCKNKTCGEAAWTQEIYDMRNLFWEASGKPLRSSGNFFGSFWEASGRGNFSQVSGKCPGSLWEALGASGKPLGSLWQAYGKPLGNLCTTSAKLLGSFVEASENLLGASGKLLKASRSSGKLLTDKGRV